MKKLTGDKLCRSIKEGKLSSLKKDIEDEIVEKIADKIKAKKREILNNIKKSKAGKTKEVK
jgi:hypothetical protein